MKSSAADVLTVPSRRGGGRRWNKCGGWNDCRVILYITALTLFVLISQVIMAVNIKNTTKLLTDKKVCSKFPLIRVGD